MRLLALPTIVLAVSLSACGDDAPPTRSSPDEAADASRAATVAKDELMACLTGAGLEATDQQIDYPEALKERDRIVESIDIAGSGDLTGLGSATWYEDEEAAVAGDEAGALVRTDDVRRGVAGRIAWDWAGEAAAADAIEGCLAK